MRSEKDRAAAQLTPVRRKLASASLSTKRSVRPQRSAPVSDRPARTASRMAAELAPVSVMTWIAPRSKASSAGAVWFVGYGIFVLLSEVEGVKKPRCLSGAGFSDPSTLSAGLRRAPSLLERGGHNRNHREAGLGRAAGRADRGSQLDISAAFVRHDLER